MRFQPRLVRPDQPDDALELPPDLAELAEQLTADAQWLAKRYPAHGQEQPAAAVDRGRRWVRAAAVAVLLVGVGLWSGKIWRAVGRPARGGVDAALAADDAAARKVSADEGGLLRETAAGTGALLFGGLTGGEQEGVLDLLEEQSAEEARVSI